MLANTNRGVAVIGIGARTPVGLNARSAAAAVRAGVASMAQHPFMVDRMGDPMVVCADTALPPELAGVERFLELALPSALEAVKPLLGKHHAFPPIPVFLALPEERPGKPANLESLLANRLIAALRSPVPIHEVTCHPLGHAAGILCLEQAASFIRSGGGPICLIGGIDSYLEPETLEWLDALEQLHSEATIWGFCPGEGAAFCLLASPETADSLNLPAAVELLSAGSAAEPNRIKTETVCIGEGLSEAFKKTLAALPRDSRVSHTICDMNGEPYRANEYGFAMLRSPGKFADDADFQTPADCWGDMGAASGALFTILAASAALKGYAPGPLTFVWASSEGGLRAAALLQAPAKNATN